MKRCFAFFILAAVCLLFAACSTVRTPLPERPLTGDRTAAVVDVENLGYSTIELPETTAVTEPFKIDVVVAAPVTVKPVTLPPEYDPPPVVVTEAPPTKYYTVKFVDTNGYTALSVQTVPAGSDAVPPAMPQSRGDLLFRGWDTKYTNVRKSMIVKAIYQKEWLTVDFYDADGTLLKTEQVLYGENATPPVVEDRPGYDFDGWSTSYEKILEDKKIVATYYEIPDNNYITLTDAYKLLSVEENYNGLSAESYYRKSYSGTYTIRNTDYAGNILYGNFSDTLDIYGFDFASFDGYLVFAGRADDPKRTYSIRLTILCDGEVAYTKTLKEAGTFANFSVDLQDVHNLTVRLEPMRNDFAFYENPTFIGGLVSAAFYEK